MKFRAAVLTIAAASLAPAQTTFGSITGLVPDQSGGTINRIRDTLDLPGQRSMRFGIRFTFEKYFTLAS